MQIFTKISPDFQLGHLFEHIFLNQFTAELRNQNFLAFLDYEIYGETHNNGVVKIFWRAFSKECEDFFKANFHDFKVDFPEEEVASAAIQIFAEKQMTSSGFFDGYLNELIKISSQKWKIFNKEEFEKEPEKPFDEWLDLQNSNDFRETSLVLKSSDDFLEIAKIIINSASEDIERELFCFTKEVFENFDGENYISGIIFRKSNLQAEDFKLEHEIVQEIIEKAKNHTKNISKMVKIPESQVLKILENIKIETFKN